MKYTANCIYGYFGKQVPVMVDRKLESIPYGQCGVRVRKDGDQVWLDLISYESLILSYEPYENIISFERSEASPDYSRTTAKHVSAFCKEYIPAMTYQAIKKLYHEQYDIAH